MRCTRSGPGLSSSASGVTVGGDWGEPSGESRLTPDRTRSKWRISLWWAASEAVDTSFMPFCVRIRARTLSFAKTTSSATQHGHTEKHVGEFVLNRSFLCGSAGDSRILFRLDNVLSGEGPVALRPGEASHHQERCVECVLSGTVRGCARRPVRHEREGPAGHRRIHDRGEQPEAAEQNARVPANTP